jgi:UDP-N-acetylenolpyruvoylglucosamine reductase
MKGRIIGGASVAEIHANWIVNARREATAKDVLALIDLCRETARAKDAVELEPEVKVWS